MNKPVPKIYRKAFDRSPSDIRFKPACQHIAVQLIVMAPMLYQELADGYLS